MNQWFKAYWFLLYHRLRSIRQYPLDMAFGILGTVVWHLPNFLLIDIVFDRAQIIRVPKGYLLVLYGLSVFGDGVQHTFAEALWQFGNVFVRSGAYDSVLTRPMPPLVQVLASRFDIDGMGGILWGLFCCLYGLRIADAVSLGAMTKLFLSLGVSANVYLSINILTSSLAFVAVDNFPVTHTVFQLHSFGRFPMTIYPRWARTLLTLAVPVFCATYYPAAEIFSRGYLGALFLFMLSILMLVLGIFTWQSLSKIYKSTGA